ncbi:MAG TPA: DUF3857 and transglutaminase domain-containing protein [Candidatus Acidoferrum sp.]
MRTILSFAAVLSFCALAQAPAATASGNAPPWMHAVVNAPIPAHDEKTNAVLLYSEDILNAQGNGKLKTIKRRAYKILRPDGSAFGTIRADYDAETKITGLRGWCIPADGKDYEIKDKDVIETALFGVEDGALFTDMRTKILQIPASVPGNIVGYEIEQEERPYVLEDEWMFQQPVPTREARYTIQLPAGWEYKAVWMNYPEVAAKTEGTNQWTWVVGDVKALRPENQMPPWRGVAGHMVVSLIPPSGGSAQKGFENWREMGNWEANLERGRRDPSAEIKQKVAALTAGQATQLAKMRSLAQFVQRDIRYVAIELGIGGWQPHAATEVFAHRYGDCKDKANLMSGMLKEIGIESFPISINTERGGVTAKTPAHMGWFNHEILAIQLPADLQDPSLVALVQDQNLGRILIFDPTDDLTPFGTLRGDLQANFGLLVTPSGGELIELPKLPAGSSGVHRSAKLTLKEDGTLSGDVTEVRLGDRANSQRYALKSAVKSADQIKPIETMLAGSLSTFRLTKASVTNLNETDRPVQFDYSLIVEKYAKSAGGLLLVRPRVLGQKGSDLLETKEARQFPVVFQGPSQDIDTFEITMPAGYEIDDLPPAVNADYGFASYHSKAEVNGNVLKYTRTFEVKEPAVPLEKVGDLKKLYRIIANDERNTAVLKPSHL